MLRLDARASAGGTVEAMGMLEAANLNYRRNECHCSCPAPRSAMISFFKFSDATNAQCSVRAEQCLA